MKIVTTRRFEKRYARLQPALQNKVNKTLQMFITDPFSPKLHNHALT